jgi:hypothetical protein
MGMDLVPMSVKDSSDDELCHFHSNWSGWTLLAGLLVEVGADMTHFSGSNDGDEVPQEHAEQWGELIEEKLDMLYYIGRSETMTGANNISQPEMLLVGDGYKLFSWSSQEGIVIHRLSDLPGLHGFVRHFAAFCKNSNGFSQY